LLRLQNFGFIKAGRYSYRMSHYVVDAALYEKAFNELEQLGGKMSWIESIGEQKKSYVKKMKYVCDGCNIKLWGKSDLNIICGNCNSVLYSKS